jgi:hypothetical protein
VQEQCKRRKNLLIEAPQPYPEITIGQRKDRIETIASYVS